MGFVANCSNTIGTALCVTVWASAASAQTPDIRFASPSGNINCTINQFVAACRIAEFAPTYTNRPDSCAGEWGNYFYLLGNGDARIGCINGEVLPAADTLPYGASIELSTITCVSRIDGITCTNAQGGGFVLRRAVQRIF